LCKALAMISPDLRDRSLVENVRTILSFIEDYKYSKYSNDVNGVDCPLPEWLFHRRYDQDNGDMPQPTVTCAACDNLIAFCFVDECACYPVIRQWVPRGRKARFLANYPHILFFCRKPADNDNWNTVLSVTYESI
ncbi:MAG: hypothetical protein ABF979_16325, partial [Gluconobacter sp.]|uniref:hypothetical protein n=1 Tax=Gluconobacter sp. TaxID=1876758 RepID=UPI0039EBD564